MRSRPPEKNRYLRRCCPRLASRSREGASRAGPLARAPALDVFVRRFAFGDALLQLPARFTRCRSSRVIGTGHPPLALVDCIEGRLDSFLDGGPHFPELVRDSSAHVFDEILSRPLRASGAARDPLTGFLAALRSEEQRSARAERNSKKEWSDSHCSFPHDDVWLWTVVLVLVVPLVIVVRSGPPPHALVLRLRVRATVSSAWTWLLLVPPPWPAVSVPLPRPAANRPPWLHACRCQRAARLPRPSHSIVMQSPSDHRPASSRRWLPCAHNRRWWTQKRAERAAVARQPGLRRLEP